MAMRKFYFEYDEIDREWMVLEEGGGQEHGQWFDTLMFCTCSKQDAVDAIELLMELQKNDQQ